MVFTDLFIFADFFKIFLFFLDIVSSLSASERSWTKMEVLKNVQQLVRSVFVHCYEWKSQLYLIHIFIPDKRFHQCR